MSPHGGRDNAYQSKYWPALNGLANNDTVFLATWVQKSLPQSERESALLDVIGAFDLLLLQGLTAERAMARLGLRKTRDELVQELDSETARRLSTQPPPTRDQPRPHAS